MIDEKNNTEKDNPEPTQPDEVVKPGGTFSRFYTDLEITHSHHGPNPFKPAVRYGNTIPVEEIQGNLKLLFRDIMDPIADVYGHDFCTLTSVYRNPDINAHPQVQGSPNSAHLVGLAADTVPMRAADVVAFLNKNWKNFNLDRVIFETRPGRESFTSWLHVQRLSRNNLQVHPNGLWYVSPTFGVYDRVSVETMMTLIISKSKKVPVV